MKHNIPLTYQLETERFFLKIPEESDLPHVFSATRYKGFNEGMQWDPPENMEELQAPLERSHTKWKEEREFSFSIRDKETKEFKGRISIRTTEQEAIWNVGFWTHPRSQGKGVMTESLAAMLKFGFEELKAQKIEAEYAIWNKASEKVLHRNGLNFVEFLAKGFQKRGEWVAENVVAIDKKEWEGIQK
ncbi:MAG: GNAT family protein [Bacteroidia bacterium]|nr:GNAT family protein [Bacteroidia bacterium]